jgi:hypothetical protein
MRNRSRGDGAHYPRVVKGSKEGGKPREAAAAHPKRQEQCRWWVRMNGLYKMELSTVSSTASQVPAAQGSKHWCLSASAGETRSLFASLIIGGRRDSGFRLGLEKGSQEQVSMWGAMGAMGSLEANVQHSRAEAGPLPRLSLGEAYVSCRVVSCRSEAPRHQGIISSPPP